MIGNICCLFDCLLFIFPPADNKTTGNGEAEKNKCCTRLHKLKVVNVFGFNSDAFACNKRGKPLFSADSEEN